ncbi:hypothetical protein F5Y16DRAFT_305417 [Xylariaceae sp. FL0255]|nr:hypothetical protein F5Y16DRAFT_305417 [Xylariaceae sp. FL0255]
MRALPIVNKARKPKFELHLWIYDLNNVPLVAGTSSVKWHIPGSIHGEHRGRTAKCSIDKINHRVTYNYSKTVPLRISIDRSNHLSECMIEFEVLQEFPMTSGSREEKMSLGNVKLNLSEYVEESETFPRRSTASRFTSSPEQIREKPLSLNTSVRKPSLAASPMSPGGTSTGPPSHHAEENDVVDEEAEEGIVRRYLMQDSKVNSTLKLGILMVQIDGERNYIAPPLKSATMFNSGISGIIMSGNDNTTLDSDDASSAKLGGSLPSSMNKSRDTAEAQDMYRRALAASWDCQPGELPADECIEDIFAGGTGWIDSSHSKKKKSSSSSSSRRSQHVGTRRSGSSSSSSFASASTASGSDDVMGSGTLRPADVRRMQDRLRSHRSNLSDETVTNAGRNGGEYELSRQSHHSHNPFRFSSSPHRSSGRRDSTSHSSGGRHHHHHQHNHSHHHGSSLFSIRKEDSGVSLSDEPSSTSASPVPGGLYRDLVSLPGLRGRSESMTSLVPTLGSVGSERGGGLHGGSVHGAGRRGPVGGGDELHGRREIDEYEIRDDLVAWKLPGTTV